ncbi:MAG: sugar ABC transporter ATP-binding protein [Tissierellia bacterium]|nr:sugar ABC transporter ATP-binding protein [Tissierellia bacterium]
MSELLEMRSIVKTFPGVKALDNVDFTLKKGSIHALMGENGAGKSTLMKCLFGIYTEDSGEISIDGQKVNFQGPKDALEHGVAMVHQELNQVMKRSVAENMMLGRFPSKRGIVNHKKMNEYCLEVFRKLNLDVNPKTIIEKHSVAKRQLIEIAKAVSYEAKILVLDEPTSSLTEDEVEKLFDIMNALKAQGVGIIYISHKMDEILRISDEVTVMRDGKYIATEKAENLTQASLIRMMVGRELKNTFPEKKNAVGKKLLEIKNLTGKYKPSVIDASFDLYQGEVLGVAGLVGSRRSELLETIFGLREKESGQIFFEGEEISNKNPKEAIENGFALVTEERRATGIFPEASIKFNATIANLKNYKKGLYLPDSPLRNDTQRVIESIRVKTPNQKTRIFSLSGGNQQKVIIGRWLLTQPKVLLLDEPTRGIDVGAKFEIYELILTLASQGKGVIIVSSEMTELLGLCDRIMVMSNGKIAGVEKTEDLTQEKIMELQAKYV